MARYTQPTLWRVTIAGKILLGKADHNDEIVRMPKYYQFSKSNMKQTIASMSEDALVHYICDLISNDMSGDAINNLLVEFGVSASVKDKLKRMIKLLMIGDFVSLETLLQIMKLLMVNAKDPNERTKKQIIKRMLHTEQRRIVNPPPLLDPMLETQDFEQI